jgi:bifunctional non-homologous end joining protein LigD
MPTPRTNRKTATAPRADLREYRSKRDFRATPEPAPASASKRAKHAKRDRAEPAKGERFVVHEHHARRLHWDLRLEHDGVLESWAIPNGIPVDPAENRKAVHVEDHPLDYIDFEGEIPAGSYGAGRVAIWDRGRYECEKREDGKLVVVFHGERLRGRYALFRTGSRSGSGGAVGSEDERDWMIHRMDPPESPREPMPEHLAPMLATPARLPRDETGWALEIKWDGVRALAYCQPGRLRIESRNRKEIGARYPELHALGRQLGSREAVLDGEIVAFDAHGAPSFERLQHRMHQNSESAIRRLARSAPVTYVIFDLLYLEGHSTLALPYEQRRELLARLQLEGPAWQTPAYRVGEGRALLDATAAHNLEGLVAKDLQSPYRPGERSAQWLKIKNTASQELVIGGWLPGKGNREGRLGALLTGYHDDGELRYAGRVGTGFDDAELARLARALDARARRTSPFSARGVQPPRESRYVEPELVAEIQFSHWTRDRIMRHPVYRGLREDKAAADVELELPGTGGAAPGAAKGKRAAPYRVLHETRTHTEIEAAGRELRLSNRDKILYPETGFTKGALIDYYAQIAPVLLGHLAGRALTLKRYPDGVEAEYFYEKRCPAHRPEWVATAPIYSGRQQGTIDYCLVEDLPTLIWVANLAGIELHPSLARAADVDAPTALVFDLDPGAPAGLRECCRVALQIKELFDAFALRTFVKTSGAKGLQVYLPLNTPVTYEQTKPFARAVAELLQKRDPERVTARMTKSVRAGRVLVDWSQNDPHKTTVCVYSLRARERPTASTPLHWEEVQRGARTRTREPQLSLEPAALLKRVAAEGDLHGELLTLEQRLPDLGGAATT